MVTLNEIKKEATECYEVLKKCKTVGDLRNLRHVGVNEEDLIIRFPDNTVNCDSLAALPQNKEFKYVCVEMWPDTCLDYPTYYADGIFQFDVFDNMVDDQRAFLEECTLDTVDEIYNRYVSKCYTATDIKWDLDDIDNPEEVNLPKRVILPQGICEDASDYLSDNYGFCVNSLSLEYPKIETGEALKTGDYCVKVETTTLDSENIKRSMQVLIDNGIEPDEAGVVLQAIGATLIDTELDCDGILVDDIKCKVRKAS